MKTFNNLKEMEPFYDEKINAYVFKENGSLRDVQISFDLCTNSDIVAGDINALDINAWNINADDINTGNINALDINALDINADDINAWNINALDINTGNINADDINAWNINALDINADDINYYATCIARQTFKCKTVKGRRKNSLHACLDSDIVFKK